MGRVTWVVDALIFLAELTRDHAAAILLLSTIRKIIGD